MQAPFFLRLASIAAVSLAGCGIAGAQTTADAKKAHWAFQPVQRSAVPAVKLKAWPRNPIDALILARLEKEELTPSKEADRATLMRRLKFDVLGLPPTPEELDAFVKDADPLAYEKLVDRYLASPHFGERWARHWLDAVRFAESDGFETNQPRANAWPYRDWVIRALNGDMPYDRFIKEQLAGDQLGADEATGFLVGGPHDKVKSPDINLTLMQRGDELHDIVSTTSSTFLGLTVGCARCHNHKFDPISQVDYYAMRAVFAGVQHGERPVKKEADAARIQELRKLLADLEREIIAAEPIANPGAKEPQRMPVNALGNVEKFAPVKARFVRFTIEATNNLEPCIDELEIFTADAKNVALGAKATSSGDYPGAAIHKLEHINDGKYGNSRSWISNTAGKGWVQLELRQAETIERIEWARDREGKYADRLPVKYRIEVALEPGQWQLVASSADRFAFGVKLPERMQARLLARRADLEKQLRAAEGMTTAYVGRFTAPEPTHRLHRGDPMQKREQVGPAALTAFGGQLKVASKEPTDAERRMALANWIVDPANPLTARVLVNRLWHHHFGTGIVATPSDFGLNGAKPSHPELIDWLASEFLPSPHRGRGGKRLVDEAYPPPDPALGDLPAVECSQHRRPRQGCRQSLAVALFAAPAGRGAVARRLSRRVGQARPAHGRPGLRPIRAQYELREGLQSEKGVRPERMAAHDLSKQMAHAARRRLRRLRLPRRRPDRPEAHDLDHAAASAEPAQQPIHGAAIQVLCRACGT